MKRCLTFSLAAGLILASAGLLRADAGDEALKAALAVQKQLTDVDTEREKAVAPLVAKQSELSEVRSALTGKPAEPKDLEQREKAIADINAQIEMCQRRLATLEAALAAAKITDPAQRQAKLKETDEQAQKVQEATAAARKPFEEKAQAIKDKTPTQTAALKKAFDAAFHDGAGDLAEVKSQGTSGDFYSDFWHVTWKKGGKDAAWCHFFTHPPTPQAATTERKLDDKYPILADFGGQSVWLQVGNVEVRFSISDPTQFPSAKAADVLKKLVDLEALTKLGQ